MNTYETLFIVNPDLEEAEIEKTVAIIQDLITSSGGTILRLDKWGKRQLAYQIQKKREGYYVLIYFQASPSFIAELNRRYKLTDTIIRHLILQLEADLVEQAMSAKEPPPEPVFSGAPHRMPVIEDDELDEDDDEPAILTEDES